MDAFRQDLRYALRLLRRSPLFTLVAAGAIALGVGAVATIYSAATALLLRPPAGVTDAANTVAIGRTTDGGNWRSFSYPLYRDLRAGARTLDGVAAFTMARAIVGVTPTSEGEQTVAHLVSDNYFSILGVRPAAGRFFVAAEDSTPMTHPVAVISHRLWQSRFGGDPAVVGRTATINGRPFTIVGVAAPEFGGTLGFVHVDLFVPLMMQDVMLGVGGGEAMFTDRGSSWLQVLGRVAEGRTTGEVAAELGAVVQREAREQGENVRGLGVQVGAVRGVPAYAQKMVTVFVSVLMTVALLVLLIASLNVANMLLAQASAREREVAVRIALGAGRGRLVRQMLAESVVLWLLGGGAGVLLAVGGARLLERFAPVIDGVPVQFAFDVNGGVLLVGLLIALVTGAVFGLLPAVHAARRAVAPVLRAGAGAGDTRGRLRNGLVAAQLAFSVLLLVGAGLFLRALERGQRIDPGFRLEGIAVAPVQAHRLGYTPEQEWAFYTRVAERLAAQPGVEAVGYTSLLPLGLSDAGIGIQVPGHEPPSGRESISTSYHEVGGDYFGLMEMPVVRGRAFAATDRPDAPRVAVVNESFARRYWPTSEAVGRTFTISGEPHTIVGVVRDARMRSLSDPPGPFLFLAAEQRRPSGTTLLVRTDGRAEGTAVVASVLRQTVRGLDSRVPVPAVQSLEEAVSIGLLPQRVAAAVTGVLGATGLLLAALGLYGVVAYSVSRRTREIGVRMAIGATPRAVVLMVVRQGARLAAVGLVVGVGLALLAGQALAPFLLGVSATDPVTLGAVPLVLAAVALAASWVPARRAARVGPAVALRSE